MNSKSEREDEDKIQQVSLLWKI